MRCCGSVNDHVSNGMTLTQQVMFLGDGTGYGGVRIEGKKSFGNYKLKCKLGVVAKKGRGGQSSKVEGQSQ